MNHRIDRIIKVLKNPGARPKIPLLAVALLVLASMGLTQEAALTIGEAVEIALSRHPDVLTAEQAVRAAAGRRLQAEARPDPSLSLSTESIPFNLKNREGAPTEFNLGLEQTFEFPGRRALRAEIARAGEDLASLELERIRLVLAARVKKAYYRAVWAERVVAALEPAVELLDRMISSFELAYQNGKAAYGDVLRARIEKARLLNRIIEGRRERTAARIEFFHLLGRPGGDPARLSTELVFFPIQKTSAEILDAARRTRPSLKIAALRASQAETMVRLSSLNRKPDLSAGLFLPSKNIRSWGFILGLSLPLSQKRWTGERAEAEASREASLIASGAAEKRMTALIDEAYAGVRAAEEQARVFEQKLLGEIRDELAISIDHYQYGKIEAFALLDLTRSATEAEIEHLRALYLYAVSLADLDIAGEDGE